MPTVLAAIAAAIIGGVIYVVAEWDELLPSGRVGDLVRGAFAVVILGGVLIAPRSFSEAVDWYGRMRADKIREQILDVLPHSVPPTSSPDAAP